MSCTQGILADVTFYILTKPSAACRGNCFIDEEVMPKVGITDLSHYNVVPGANLYRDLFVD